MLIFWISKTISWADNNTSLSLKHSCFVCVEDWRIKIFWYFYFKCLLMGERLLKSSINFAINRFSDNFQTGIFVAEHEIWVKIIENLLNRLLITCTIKCFKKKIWNGFLTLSLMKIFVATSVLAPILLEIAILLECYFSFRRLHSNV